MVHPIPPKYCATIANAVIELGIAPVEIRSDGETVIGSGTSRLELANEERVVVEVETTFDGYRIAHHADLNLKFGPFGQLVRAVVVGSQLNSLGAKLQFVVNGAAFTQVRDRCARLSSAIIHIINFPEFFCVGGKECDFRHANQRLGRVVLRNSVWEIELQALPLTNEITKQLKANGGNAITHVARITRSNARNFTCKQLAALVHDLHRFLSFARGSWTSVFGAVGYDGSGDEVCIDWSQRISAPWQVCSGWFDTHHGETLAAVFPGFVKLMHDPVLAKACSAALHWYLRSNRAGKGAGVDGGLILSVAALERLSLSILSRAGARKPEKSAEKIRHACEHLNIETSIPQFYSGLRSLDRHGTVFDGPRSVIDLRNELVHPKRRLSGNLGPAIYEAWQLAQWYIEVMLLKLCGYQGVYSYRLQPGWVGEVRTFP